MTLVIWIGIFQTEMQICYKGIIRATHKDLVLLIMARTSLSVHKSDAHWPLSTNTSGWSLSIILDNDKDIRVIFNTCLS